MSSGEKTGSLARSPAARRLFSSVFMRLQSWFSAIIGVPPNYNYNALMPHVCTHTGRGW